ncbi:DUF4007 family protein [Thalassotalea mangrovi]|uniref:DUF4007 family protein n=1 Tax=Thalassotalea mangrovi TaxID=2572245 RepID=A0A4U1B6Y4_9GAMM|nr:DUF4007 family protein [Thalassotalea mangrovi]TKB46337.1 DUF4007 family protein [Thalassotalea mangrovi]
MQAKFSGHETFPLRYGWLYKLANYVNSKDKLPSTSKLEAPQSIVELGVGKNMVDSICYWGKMCGVVNENELTAFGKYLFSEGSLNSARDPYLEKKSSIWLIHYLLNRDLSSLTAYRFFYNFSALQHFEKSILLRECIKKSEKLVSNSLFNEATLKKDIDCFLLNYCGKRKASGKKNIINEDDFVSPLSELNLVADLGNGNYSSELTERPDLATEVFIFALAEFFKQETKISKREVINFETILKEPGSPGRIFRLSANGLGYKLDEACELTTGISWVEGANSREIKVDKNITEAGITLLSKSFYGV